MTDEAERRRRAHLAHVARSTWASDHYGKRRKIAVTHARSVAAENPAEADEFARELVAAVEAGKTNARTP